MRTYNVYAHIYYVNQGNYYSPEALSIDIEGELPTKLNLFKNLKFSSGQTLHAWAAGIYKSANPIHSPSEASFFPRARYTLDGNQLKCNNDRNNAPLYEIHLVPQNGA